MVTGRESEGVKTATISSGADEEDVAARGVEEFEMNNFGLDGED